MEWRGGKEIGWRDEMKRWSGRMRLENEVFDVLPHWHALVVVNHERLRALLQVMFQLGLVRKTRASN